MRMVYRHHPRHRADRLLHPVIAHAGCVFCCDAGANITKQSADLRRFTIASGVTTGSRLQLQNNFTTPKVTDRFSIPLNSTACLREVKPAGDSERPQ
jgi:hypothetical protein